MFTDPLKSSRKLGYPSRKEMSADRNLDEDVHRIDVKLESLTSEISQMKALLESVLMKVAESRSR